VRRERIPVIEAILPAEAAAEEAFTDLPAVALFPEEEAVIAKAVDKRRREFTTARACARAALARLGLPPVPIVPGQRGAPQWPDGVVGSMTHCTGYRACAVARDRDLLTIGLDAEPHDKLPDGVLGAVSSPEERRRLAALAAAVPGTHWDRILFSVKESVYKAWFPLTRRWLGFEDASVTIDPEKGTFTARLLIDVPHLNDGPLTGFTGRWLVDGGLIITAIAMRPGTPGRLHPAGPQPPAHTTCPSPAAAWLRPALYPPGVK
jgi:4'-phosphopantetheinyl transferase EntD